MITYTAEEITQKISSHGCQLLFYCILWRVYMTLFSQEGLWFVLERAYAKEWGSPNKSSWLKCKMLWTEHRDVLACLFHSAAPSQHRAGQAAAALALMHRAHSTCYRSHFCQESLCYFCASSHDILACNYKEAQQWASEEPVTTCPSILKERAPCSTSGPSSSPANPLLDIPSPSHKKHRSVFLGCNRRLCVCTPMIPRGHVLCNRGSPRACVQRCGRTSHWTVTQHTPVSDNNAQFTTYGHENAWNRPTWQENIHSGREIHR